MISHQSFPKSISCASAATLLLLLTACKSPARVTRLSDSFNPATIPTASDKRPSAPQLAIAENLNAANKEDAAYTNAVIPQVTSTAQDNLAPQINPPAFYPDSRMTEVTADESQTLALDYMEPQQPPNAGTLAAAESLVSFVPSASAAPTTQIASPTVSPLSSSSAPHNQNTKSPASNASVATSPRLVIRNVRVNGGPLKVAVFSSAKDFPNPVTAAHAIVLPANQTEVESTLPALGAFAVAVYQDINSDGELNRNKLGVPVEPFAFSNNAMGRRGPPTFEQAVVAASAHSSAPLDVIINLP